MARQAQAMRLIEKRTENYMLKISAIYIENRKDRCVTDNPFPIFSFTMESDHQNVLLKKAEYTLNDWKKVTDIQTAVIYDGKSLKSCKTYKLHIHITDNYGETAEKTAVFETGRMGKDWEAEWITDTGYRFHEKKVSPKPMTFKKDFSLRQKVKHARIYATALGIYELELNGRKVGEDYFAPGYTSYKHQLQYQIYNITEFLTQEDNRLVCVVGGGWAVGAYTYARMNRIYAKRQALLCEICLTYEDGTMETIGTDGNWDVTEEGNVKEAEFYNGETYDATVNLDRINWKKAGSETPDIHPQLIAQYGAPVRAHEVLSPVTCTRAASGMLIYDFGQNLAGVVKASIKGMTGQRVVFYHAEILMDGELFTKPLRTAKQQAVYICKEGQQEYSPRMTYMGFRYVGVTGIQEEDLKLEVLALYSDVQENGTFVCSEQAINQLQSCIQWGAKSNFVDIPTDCPQRDERLGWTGDIALFSPTAAYNFDMSLFFDKWLKDVKAEQAKGGGIPMIVPMVKIYNQMEMLIPMAVDHWGDACILVPWAEYLARGNTELLREMYPVMKKYLKACKFWAELFSFGKNRRIWKLFFHYGDWCAPGMSYQAWMKRGKWTATACLAHSSAIVSRIAKILGEESDAKRYHRLSKETAEAYRNVLMDASCKIKGEEFQTAYVLPLYYGLLSGEDKKKAAAHLVRLVREGNYQIGTGFPGTPYILFALMDNGYPEDAYKMLLNDTCPSWAYEVKAGGTTFWERWDALREDGTCNLGDEDGSAGMVSFNHYASGAIGDFFYRRIAGIEPVEGGYRKFRIAPVIGGGLTYAKGTVNTRYGQISSSWEVSGKKWKLSVVVPAGTKCQIVLPSGEKVIKGSGSWKFEEDI